MLRDLLEQSKAKESQQPAQQTSQEQTSTSDSKSDEEFHNVEHEEAHHGEDDSEFETEDEGSDADYGQEDHSHSMFESLLRSHLMGGGPGRGRPRHESMPRDSLHPFTQVLSAASVEDCVQIENACFPEHERATREKVRHIPDPTLEVFSTKHCIHQTFMTHSTNTMCVRKI